MALQHKTLWSAVAGAVAAISAWLMIDAFTNVGGTLRLLRTDITTNHNLAYYAYAGSFSLLLCFLIGSTESLTNTSPTRRGRVRNVSLGIGALAATIAPSIGLALNAMFRSNYPDADSSFTLYILDIFFMSLVWAIIAGGAGSISGLSRTSKSIAWSGAAGGLIGGLIGGVLFQLSVEAFDPYSAIGGLARLGSLTTAGMLGAYLSVMVPLATRQTWLRRLADGQPCIEYTVGRSQFSIGADSECDIVIEGDQSVAPTHVVLESIPQSRRFRLRHCARSPIGQLRYVPTVINGESIASEKWLCDGDVFSIGQTVFEFRDRASQSDRPLAERAQNRIYTEDRVWEMTSGKTTAIRTSLLPVEEAPSQEPLAPAVAYPSNVQAGSYSAPVYSDRTAELASPIHEQDVKPYPSADATDSSRAVERVSIGTRLACIDGPYQGQSFPLTHATAMIGRSLDYAVAIPADPQVSRVHAKIVYQGGRHIISDAGSANGLWVNEEPVAEPRALRVMDVITVGGSKLRYE